MNKRIEDMTPMECIEELRRRKEIARENAAKRDREKLRTVMTEDQLFSTTYLPFVIAEVAWDYADCISDLCQIARIHETKKLNRAIRELRREYDQRRFKVINSSWRNGETVNMILFQDEMREFFGKTYKTYCDTLTQACGKVEENTLTLIGCVYVCLTVMEGLKRYDKAQRLVLADILGHKVSSILPPELERLEVLVAAFIGDMPVTDEIKKAFSEKSQEFAESLVNVGYTRKKIEPQG